MEQFAERNLRNLIEEHMGTEQASQRIRQALYNQLEMRYVPKDEILVKIDTMPQHVWVILEGTVEASSRFCP